MAAANDNNLFGDHVIAAYSRKDAIEDGFLVDLNAVAPDICREHFKAPVACTSAVWDIIDRAVKNPKWCNDLNGVLHDVFHMSKAFYRELSPATRVFQVIIKGAGRKSTFTFKMVCSPGDDAKPVMTIMLPEEE